MHNFYFTSQSYEDELNLKSLFNMTLENIFMKFVGSIILFGF